MTQANNGYDGPDIKDQSVFVASINQETKYKDFVSALFKHDTQDMEHMHAALGVAGEAGELADAIKKHVVYGKKLDRKNIVEELGDLRFYMQQIMNMHDITEEEVLQGNANKLSKRYPAGQYSDTAAVARLDKLEFNPNDYDDWERTEFEHVWHSNKANGFVYSDEASQYDTTLYQYIGQAISALKDYIENHLEPKPRNFDFSDM